METPKNKRESIRTPTPRLSERKKSLFSSKKEAQEDLVSDIVPMESVKQILKESASIPTRLQYAQESIDDLYSRESSQTNMTINSNSILLKNKVPCSYEKLVQCKENLTSREEAEQLEQLFNKALMLSRKVEEKAYIQDVELKDLVVNKRNGTAKRPLNMNMELDSSPNVKVAKVEKKQLLHPNINSIPPKKFYSSSKTSTFPKVATRSNSSPTSPKLRKAEHHRRKHIAINKGVGHKIRRGMKHSDISRRSAHSSIDIVDIINNVSNQKLRNLITCKRKIENLYETGNPFTVEPATQCAVAALQQKTLSNHSIEFSDIESEDDLIENIDDQISTNVNESPPSGNKSKKFFKDGGTKRVRKEVQITGNIKAAVCDGKIVLVERKKQTARKFKIRNPDVANEFASAQATVNAILKNLDDSAFGEVQQPERNCNIQNSIEGRVTEDDYCSEFRNRLPYNTSDPELIEQQHLLLDFLINNGICTEENFTIFIADPENHKEEASRIVDQIVVVVNEKSDCDGDMLLENMPPNCHDHAIYDTDALNIQPANNQIIESNMEPEIGDQNKAVQHNIAKYIKERQVSAKQSESSETSKLFPIFTIGKCRPIPQESCRKALRSWTGGKGANQYQIDAGQKNFGATECKQCGLLYSVHEPEEEKLHRDYHASLSILRFKGWSDEHIVATYPEWGADGRIIKITENSHTKRKERLNEVLNIVDKELGFSSYIFPEAFVAYLAVRKSEIVGLCLVQPLTTAHRYFSMNGVDYVTDESYDAKCGISRIWVSPLHRRLHIASKLIQAAQFNTIFGAEISMDELAFSAPTTSGKEFAKKVTKMENFLVYF